MASHRKLITLQMLRLRHIRRPHCDSSQQLLQFGLTMEMPCPEKSLALSVTAFAKIFNILLCRLSKGNTWKFWY